MPVLVGACRCFFQELKLLVFRRRVAVADGGGAIIHSLAFNDIAGNMLQLDSGGGGGERLSWDRTKSVRRLTFLWEVVQLILLAGLLTSKTAVLADVLEGTIPGLAFKNRRTRAHTTVEKLNEIPQSVNVTFHFCFILRDSEQGNGALLSHVFRRQF